MKLSTRDANGWIARPDPAHAGALIYGGDAQRVAEKRRVALAAIVGPQGEEEMRLTRITAADLRRDGAMLDDAMRAQGFFPGARAVLVEAAADGLAKAIGAALAAWAPGDAQLIVTAGQLGKGSALRKLFEPARNAAAIAIYDDPPGPDEIAALLRAAGLGNLSGEAQSAVGTYARMLEPGDFRQMVEKLGLYMLGANEPVAAEDVAAVAPISAEAEVDTLIAAVAAGESQKVSGLIRRLEAQGATGVSLSIMALRHFRTLHAAASSPEGPSRGIGAVRPPVFGPRRERMAREAQAWGRARLEAAIGQLVELDLGLRSASPAPVMARVERLMIRLAMGQQNRR